MAPRLGVQNEEGFGFTSGSRVITNATARPPAGVFILTNFRSNLSVLSIPAFKPQHQTAIDQYNILINCQKILYTASRANVRWAP